jgi:hypothetical protein
MSIGIGQRATKRIAELDKYPPALFHSRVLILTFIQRDLLDGLRSRGFQLNYGIHGTGPGLLVWSKGGGYYLGTYIPPSFHKQHFLTVPYIETGASRLIVEGKIKLKSGPQIEKFTEHTIQFDDGSELEADVIIFATGWVCWLSFTLSHLRCCN